MTLKSRTRTNELESRITRFRLDRRKDSLTVRLFSTGTIAACSRGLFFSGDFQADAGQIPVREAVEAACSEPDCGFCHPRDLLPVMFIDSMRYKEREGSCWQLLCSPSVLKQHTNLQGYGEGQDERKEVVVRSISIPGTVCHGEASG